VSDGPLRPPAPGCDASARFSEEEERSDAVGRGPLKWTRDPVAAADERSTEDGDRGSVSTWIEKVLDESGAVL
jgi:hypothetical protein